MVAIVYTVAILQNLHSNRANFTLLFTLLLVDDVIDDDNGSNLS